jgi:hypothetical protein
VSAGGTWNTPNPNWGIRTPLFNRILGTWVMPSKLPSSGRRKPVTARLERANPGARAGVARQ